MSAGILNTFVGHDAEVVTLAQHGGDDGARERLADAGSVATGETTFDEGLVELRGGVVASGVRLEGPLDMRRSFLVDRDGADLLAIDVLPDVDVADGRLRQGAATFSRTTSGGRRSPMSSAKS